MQIGQLALRAGVTAKTVRYYEDIGVLPAPGRAANGYREYAEDALPRLRFIRDAQATGLTLQEIASILDMRDNGEGTCTHVVELLQRHLVELENNIAGLNRTRDQLTELIARADDLDPAGCVDPNRCQIIEASSKTAITEPAGHAHSDHSHTAPHRHSHS